MVWLGKLRVKRIKEALISKPYVFIFVFSFLFYVGLNVFLNRIYITLPGMIDFKTLWFVIPYITFNFLIVPFLVGLTVSLSVKRFKELKLMNGSKAGSGSFLGSLGVIGGIIGGACPACIAGFLPAILGVFGVAGFSLYVLPFKGLEVQLLSSALLIWAVLLLSKEPTCKVKFKKN
jgi:hypothetical protein